MQIPDNIDELVPEEMGTPITEEMLCGMEVLDDPYFFERKSRRRQRYHKVPEKMETLSVNPGTRPDIKIRWKRNIKAMEELS